jgi:branched-chain amino acid aminotransferase
MPAAERSLGRSDLFAADEVFLTGTGARIVPVSSLDGRSLGTCPGPVTKRIVEAFDALTRSTGAPFL